MPDILIAQALNLIPAVSQVDYWDALQNFINEKLDEDSPTYWAKTPCPICWGTGIHEEAVAYQGGYVGIQEICECVMENLQREFLAV